MISPEDRAKLMQWHYDTYGELLDIPADPYSQPGHIVAPDFQEEEEIAIDREMRQPPKGSRYHK